MANQQVRDILNEARAFHSRLGEVYRTSADRNIRERTRMLLFYLSRHEAHLDEALRAFASEGRKAVLNAWIPIKTVDGILAELRGITLPPDLGADELVRRALRYDDRLVAFFRLLAEKSAEEPVRQLFLALERMEQRAENTLARDTIDFSDL